MSVNMIIFNQNINAMQNYASWTQITLLCVLRLKMFMKTLRMMLKKDLIYQTIESRCHYWQAKNKNVNRLIKDEVGRNIMTEHN